MQPNFDPQYQDLQEQPVPLSESRPKRQLGNVLQFPHFNHTNLEAIAVDRPADPNAVSDDERAQWRRRAEVSRAYATILRSGGSLG